MVAGMELQRVQVAFDAGDAHRLAAFWAEAFGYEVEDNHDQIEQVVAAGFATADDYEEVGGRKRWRGAAAANHPSGRFPRLLFQEVPESKTVKDRIHLDMHVGEEGREAFVARLVELGATRLHDGRQGPHTWVTLADPEGNELCVS
jgi:predicted enzyme related to lactoylglutathione lyase